MHRLHIEQWWALFGLKVLQRRQSRRPFRGGGFGGSSIIRDDVCSPLGLPSILFLLLRRSCISSNGVASGGTAPGFVVIALKWA